VIEDLKLRFIPCVGSSGKTESAENKEFPLEVGFSKAFPSLIDL